MRRVLLAIILAAAGHAADAATYVADRTVGGATAKISITTDDTLGVLTTDNIVDWVVQLTSGGEATTLLGPNSGDTSRVQLRGQQLSATASDLIFDFSGPANAFLLFQSTVGDRSLYCVQTTNCFDQTAGEEIVSLGPLFNNFGREARSGRQVLASVTAVPEPATWAMMIAGFGVAGAGLRRRRARIARVA